MRKVLWCVLAAGWAAGAAAQAWLWREAALETNGWHAVRVRPDAEQGRGLAIRQEGEQNGFLIPLAARQRQAVAVEAELLVRGTLNAERSTLNAQGGKGGWSFAGVALYQDDGGLWLLALVEGPDGKRSVDFLESRSGVWQAQNEPATRLTREGNVSFDWKPGAGYRLRLELADGRVSARVSELAGGRVCGSASYALGQTPAVRSGVPGLIARASVASVTGFRYGMREASTANGGRAAVALLDDALPGHDRAANARLAEVLEKRGFGVARLTAEQLLAPQALTADAFRVLIVPQCDAVPAALGPAVQQFAREGGHLVFLGGPFLDRGLTRAGGAWLDREGQQRLLVGVATAHRSFELRSGDAFKAWRRSSPNRDSASALRAADEGPDGQPCLRLEVPDLQGWDVFQSPELPALFGQGQDLFTFLAKGEARTRQLAVEVIERDGARWIATAPLAPAWCRVALRLADFRFWNDSHTQTRGHAGDRLKPENAVRVSLGFSSSHTPGVGGGPHTAWLADVGTACDPLAAGADGATEMAGGIECVYPRYKVFGLSGEMAVSKAIPAFCTNVVCAIPRTLGEGFGRGAKWRFVPLAEATVKKTSAVGTCEWLLLNTRFPLAGTVVAGFGYTDPAVWSAPEVAGRIADVAERVAQGVMVEEAGAVRSAYWLGETVRVGVRVRAFGGADSPLATDYAIKLGERQVSAGSCLLPRAAEGASERELGAFVPIEPGEYTFCGRLSGGDAVTNRFSVLDPAPAPKEAFITARDGDFWLAGRKWYPVGVNFWPLYVSGMDPNDYGAGWLKDACYAPALVERDLAQMSDMGINLVSIQTPPIAGIRNLLDFLRLCKKYGVYANLYVGQASPLAFDDKGLKAYLEAGRLAGNATVFAYDTIWEPGNHVFKDDAARGKWDAAWRAWIEEQYGAVERAERDWGVAARRDKQGRVVSPPDAWFREDGAWRVQMAAYRRFMDNLTSRLWGRANRRLRELDPNHLVSFRQGNTLPYDFALSGPVKHIDFICPEGYSIRDTDEGEDAIGFITRYVDFTTGGKPIIWSEFGQSVWDAVTLAPDTGAVERQGRYSARFYRTGLAAGADGTVPWWWVGGYRVNENSDFGIVAPDRTERPAARLIREYGPRFKRPRERPQPEAWFEFDRDAHAGGYWRAAFHEGAAAYRAAATAGKALGVRSPGTGTDSATVPLVAVGNVPCDGMNPPKHLDAEFNFLRILNADGVWQEAEDGAVITVLTNRPVRARASVGNTQVATWKGDQPGRHPVRFVVLASREHQHERELGARHMPRDANWVSVDVPYLGNVDFGEFELLSKTGAPPVSLPVNVSVRMELLQRGPHIPFGEARVFTLEGRR